MNTKEMIQGKKKRCKRNDAKEMMKYVACRISLRKSCLCQWYIICTVWVHFIFITNIYTSNICIHILPMQTTSQHSQHQNSWFTSTLSTAFFDIKLQISFAFGFCVLCFVFFSFVIDTL